MPLPGIRYGSRQRHKLPDWQVAIALLFGTYPVPVVQWPANKTRIILAADDSPDNDPEEIEISDAERTLLELVAAAPLTSRQVCAAFDEKPATVHARLYRMKGRGLLVRECKAWRVADSAAGTLEIAARG